MPKIKFAKKFWGQLDSVTAYVYNRITQNSVIAKGEKLWQENLVHISHRSALKKTLS